MRACLVAPLALIALAVVVPNLPVVAQSAAPAPSASALAATPSPCVPDDVRFDRHYGVPTWVDPVHATTRAALAVRAPKAVIQLAVASDERQRARGLMCVTQIPRFAGMLFAFPNDGTKGFWMKDTLVPLDMIFVRTNGVVTSVAADVPSTTPDTPDEAIPRREAPGRFVIELAAGDAAKAGIVKGTRLAIPRIAAQ